MTGFWKVFVAAALVVAAAVAVVPLVLLPRLDEQRREHQTRELTIEAELLASTVRPALALEDPARAAAEARRLVAQLSGRLAGHRFTVVASDGTVLADTHEDPARMENHLDRPEIVAARDGLPMRPEMRRSPTLKLNMLYGATAVRAEGPGEPALLGFARVALPASDVEARGRSCAMPCSTAPPSRWSSARCWRRSWRAACSARWRGSRTSSARSHAASGRRACPARATASCPRWPRPSTTWRASSSSASSASSATRPRSARSWPAWSRACWPPTPTSACC
jgi:hypothetical protein